MSLAGQVGKVWLALGEANEQVGLAEEGVKAAGALADAVRGRFERAIADGGGTAAQVRLTESERAAREGALAMRRQERERVVRQLEILLGRYPDGRLVAGARLPGFPGMTPVGLPSELLLRRPDLLAAERGLAAAGRRVRESRLARFPSLRLTGSGGTATEEVKDLLSSKFGVWSVGGSLTQPIFQGGMISGQIERAEALDREGGARLQKAVLGAFGEVEQALEIGRAHV